MKKINKNSKAEIKKEVEYVKEKLMHPRDQKKLIEKRMVRNNSKPLLDNFDFNPADYMDVNLLLNLEKTSAEKIIDRIIEKLTDNDTHYTGHGDGTNSSRIR